MPPASAAMAGVGRGSKQEKLLGERRFPGRDCWGEGEQVLGMQCLFGGYLEELVTHRGVGDLLHQMHPGSRWQKGLEPFCVLGCVDRAVDKVGKVTASLELAFILGMEGDKRKATQRR